MVLVNLQNVSISFGESLLLDKINLLIKAGERIGILGRNGSGKSTLLRLIVGEQLPQNGDIQRKVGILMTTLTQEVPKKLNATVKEVVISDDLTEKGAYVIDPIGKKDDQKAFWEVEQKANEILSRMKLDGSALFENLSAGMKRRVLMASALCKDPDIILLDEPTNHLDIDSIIWLEDFLFRYLKTIIFVTHDRALLRHLATRIVEIDRAHLYSWSCDYDTFIKRRSENMVAEENRWHVFDKKLAQEEIWIRQGIKARRTRNEGRVRALEKMRIECRNRREKNGRIKLTPQSIERSGRAVIEAKNLSFSFGTKRIVKNFSATIMRGDKIGLIGLNGIGKTTFIQLLLKNLSPEKGTVQHGTHLKIGYFDQLRQRLNEDQSVQSNVADGNDTIMLNGKQRHVIGYLQDFLFSPQRARTPVYVLSGGEKNRLMLAKLFTQPFNVLILDEPTNDLDIETLELLEEMLFEYSGTLLLISHDRDFINKVVTSTFVFEGNGKIQQYAGGYDDYLWQGPQEKIPLSTTSKKRSGNALKKTADSRRKLGYMQQRELEQLPQKIESLEKHRDELYKTLSDPEFYHRKKKEIAGIKKNLMDLESEIKQAYERWEQLEDFLIKD
jgi:ABC transport system ATP-binding/permease protein